MDIKVDGVNESGVSINRYGNKIELSIGCLELSVGRRTAEELRDELIDELGPPDDYGKKDEDLRDELVEEFGPPDGYVAVKEA